MSTSSTGSSGVPRRLGAALVATALTAGPAVALGAAPAAYAAGNHGRTNGTSGAVVLRTGLDVGLLDKSLRVPLRATLNEVHAPASADRTALTVNLDGIDQGRPFSVLRAEVATARATAGPEGTKGYANLVHAAVHLPGLPALPLIEVQQVTSTAECRAGQHPRAASQVLGSVLVLGKRVTLSASGTTAVTVPGVGDVRLDLSKKAVTSTGAAATALALRVSVDPLKLNVAEVHGQVTLAQATCTTPGGTAPGTPEKPGGPQGGTGGNHVTAHGGSGPATRNLAETGGSSATPYVAGGAALLVAAGAGSLAYARRRRTAVPGGRG
ncbi:LPXTG cell wall anchor domain-containing protein [Streptomyces albospinus]|uniref:LPXTG cell wall anchor domain-containing protein n=1 Tax=Streptomyces albospinus TaxID=285515 RepID=A0ABQ2VJD0_9ACTN|nr:SCO1860 family LAETG-anchored protein [Streptomyces albospinus]GGU90903.1 LPXTG cell wall anchor domain-containing protein [Streptomyces albospinus]